MKPDWASRRLNPRTSAAMAALLVLRTEETSRGTHSGIISLRRFKKPPWSNSTPRAVCASMMPDISFMKTGMKCTVEVKVKAYL